jgi:hypothetical protein
LVAGTIWRLLGVLALTRGADLSRPRDAHILSVALMFIWFPFSKLMHSIWFVFSRAQSGLTYAHKGGQI